MGAAMIGAPGDAYLVDGSDRRRTAGLAAIGGSAVGAAVMGVLVFLARILIYRTAWRAPAPFGPFLALAAILILLLPPTISESLLALGRL